MKSQTTPKEFTPVISYNKIKYNNHPILPSSYRLCITGRTGSGKTTLLIKLLLLKILDYDEIYIYCPTSFQIEYQILIKAFNAGLTAEHIIGLFNYQNEMDKDESGKPSFDLVINRISEMLTEKEKGKVRIKLLSLMPDPQDIYKPNTKTILILDDVIAEKAEIKNKIGKIFTTARPYGINVILLTQSFIKCDKQFIREQTNVWMIFKESPTIVHTFYEQKSSIDFHKETDFVEFINSCWTKNLNGKKREKDDLGFMIMVQNRNETKYYNCDELFQ